MTQDIFILGAGGHGVSVANVAVSAGYRLAGFIDERRAGETVLGADVLPERAIEDSPLTPLSVAIGANFARERVAQALVARLGAERFPVLVHATASIGIQSALGPGTVVMPNATVGPNSRIGAFCIVNTNASVDHDTVMGDFASVAPGAHLGGNVHLGPRSAVSIGATVRHGVRVGADAVLGGAAYLDRDIGDGVVAWGVPARVRRSRLRTDPYL